MKLLKILLLLTGLGVPLGNSYGQHSFYRAIIDLTDSINNKLFHWETDKLGTILIDAYLQGKLKGYQFDIGHEVMKRAPVPKDDYVEWEAGTTYYFDEIVSYNDSLYTLADLDFIDSKTPPSQDKRWTRYEVLGEPISIRYYFPTIKDTLSKATLLKNMIQEMPVSYPRWEPSASYYPGDIVWYDGRNYEAVRDTEGKPPTDREYWMYTLQGSMMFLSFQYVVNGLSILFYSESQATKPQMISLLVEKLGFLAPLGLNFYAEDAFNYLNEIDQPILYQSPIGYVGFPQLVLGDSERIELAKRIRGAIKSGNLKLSKNQILDSKLHQQFLEANEEQVVTNWTLMQGLTKDDIWISLRKYDDETGNVTSTTPGIRVSFKQVQNLLGSLKGNPTTYREAIEKSQFNFRYDSVYIDTLEYLNPVFVAAKPATGYFFYETYKASTDSNLQLQNQIPGLWKSIEKLFFGQKLLVKNPFRSLYPCQYDWSGIKLELETGPVTFAKNFTLGESINNPIDSLLTPQSFTEVAVTYKKYVSGGKSKLRFEPVEVSISFIPKQVSDEPVFPVTYTFDWQDLIKIFEANSELEVLFNQINEGALKFHDSIVVYGLTASFN